MLLPGSHKRFVLNSAVIIQQCEREYNWDDFKNNGGQIAELSNARAFSVVPVPAAVWLFASGLLGLIGIARKRA